MIKSHNLINTIRYQIASVILLYFVGLNYLWHFTAVVIYMLI